MAYVSQASFTYPITSSYPLSIFPICINLNNSSSSLAIVVLSPSQAEAVRQLCTGLRALQDWQKQTMEDVKLQASKSR